MNMRKLLSLTALACVLSATHAAQAADDQCQGRFVNPITDICWECLFPITIGNVAVSVSKSTGSDGDNADASDTDTPDAGHSSPDGTDDSKPAASIPPDTENPSDPIQFCPTPPPVFERIGLAIGYWEPMALTDVTRSPYCMVNLGGTKLNVSKVGAGTAGQVDKAVPGGFYHVHWYKYPLTWWLNIITDVGCLQGGDMDIGYLSELDPMWSDSSLGLVITPEAMLFNNAIAQGACAADAIASATGRSIEALFWCAGSQGSMYPFSGFVSNEFSPLESSVLVSERMAFKLHREGLIMNSVGQNTAVCYEYPSPIIPKTRWRYQMVNMFPDVAQCHPFGRTVMRWEAGHTQPADRKNYGYLIWRKRNCVFL